jgi:hypothetical protein
MWQARPEQGLDWAASAQTPQTLMQVSLGTPTMAPERHEPNRYIASVGTRVTVSVYRRRSRLRPSGLPGGRTT